MNLRALFKPRSLLLLTAAALLSAELLVRSAGVVDFPVYEANNQVGYIPAPNQQGSFLHKNDWAFNAQHMGAGVFAPGPVRDVLLVGDSVVYGGNDYKQTERLGPSLQVALQQHSRTADQVWPISAGSWALRNELAYLRLHPEVVAQVDDVVFVLNSGDFGEASSWACESTHPRARPRVALAYVVNKYVYAFDKCGDVPADLKVPPGNLVAELQAFMAAHGDKTHFVLYPDKAETEDAALEAHQFAAGQALLAAAGARHVTRVAADGRWGAGLYKDGIHPTPEGNRVLADIVAKQVGQRLR